MSPWVRNMLQEHGYYFDQATLERAERLPPRQRAAELDGIYRRITRANAVRRARGLPPLRPAYQPAGPLWDERLRNPAGWQFAWHCPSPPDHWPDLDFGLVDYVVDHADEIECEEFLAEIGRDEVERHWWGGGRPWAEVGYDPCADWSMGWYRSKYPDGTPIMFHNSSGIEHVWEPAGYSGPRRNPQEFLFGPEAQESLPPEPRQRGPRRRKRFVDPRYAPIEAEQESFFGIPEQWPKSPLPVRRKHRSDYRSWLRYYRALPDRRLVADWNWWASYGEPRDPLGLALKSGLKQALLERGMIGDAGPVIDQLTYHTLRRTNPAGDRGLRARLRDPGLSREELLGLLVRSGEAENMIETYEGRSALVTLSYLVAAAEIVPGMDAPDGPYGPNATIVDPNALDQGAAAGWAEGSGLAVIYYEQGGWGWHDGMIDGLIALDDRALGLRGGLVPAFIENVNAGVGVVWPD